VGIIKSSTASLTEKVMTQILPVSKKSIKLARRLLREGELVAFPTDTVYGVGANAFERYAVRQIFKVKQRPVDKAIPVFITQIDDLNQVARDVPNTAWSLLERFWPGALTVVLPKSPHLPVDVTAGRDFVAVRLPDHPLCLELVVKVGRPLAVTSANLSGQPSPTTAEEVAAQLGGRIPLILDGGPTATPHPSSIVDLSVQPPRLLREGDLSLQVLREVVADLIG
jgi:L-threonylcarbamoyladenylate synthase